MPIPSLFFYFFAVVLILASLGVILARNPLYNVLSLVVAIFSLASIFISLEAFFVGIILLLVYAGAVLVFFLFVVMCLKLDELSSLGQGIFRLLGTLVGFTFLVEFFIGIHTFCTAQALEPSTIRGTIETVGQILFTDYLLPFELTSLLLFIAIFGIVSLAKGVLSTGADAAEKGGNL